VPLVTLRATGKTYPGGVTALAGLSLSVAPGEFLSLLGPSGCGKSTALRLMAGLAEPTDGGIEWPAGAAAPGDVGFVFQEPTLMPWATVEGNVALPLRLLGVGEADARRRVAETIERVGLHGFERAYPRELSGGMKMRASVARALAARPRLLLLDEPFAALDEITRFRLNDDLLALWRGQALTVVFVTHSVYESAYLSTRIAVMSARPGRVVAELRPDPPWPRGDYRTSPEYASHCRAVSLALARAMA